MTTSHTSSAASINPKHRNYGRLAAASRFLVYSLGSISPTLDGAAQAQGFGAPWRE